jgi:3-deoxy-D-manno-octulosonate 8-phosphate phosphatase (KDO 8-P phosphatase)
MENLMPPRSSSSRSLVVTRARWAKIKLFAMDVDGVLTNGTVIIDSAGGEAKIFSIIDGLGLIRLVRSGLQIAWISGRASKATTARANELKIQTVIQGQLDKLSALQQLAGQFGLQAEECIYMGDDDIDAPAIRWAGIGVSVPGGLPAALKAADYVTTRQPGLGAVREICERIATAQGLTFVP